MQSLQHYCSNFQDTQESAKRIQSDLNCLYDYHIMHYTGVIVDFEDNQYPAGLTYFPVKWKAVHLPSSGPSIEMVKSHSLRFYFDLTPIVTIGSLYIDCFSQPMLF